MKNLLLLLLCVLCLSGCKSDSQFDKRVYFSADYINYAWGNVHEGWLMDEDGKVSVYSNPAKWNFADDKGYLTNNELSANVLSCDSVIFMVGNSTLDHYKAMIPGVAYAKVSDLEWTACDGGTTSYYCYYFDPANGKYKQVILKQFGDYSRENEGQNAKALNDWIASVCKK
jgi:hypothetical protein